MHHINSSLAESTLLQSSTRGPLVGRVCLDAGAARFSVRSRQTNLSIGGSTLWQFSKCHSYCSQTARNISTPVWQMITFSTPGSARPKASTLGSSTGTLKNTCPLVQSTADPFTAILQLNSCRHLHRPHYTTVTWNREGSSFSLA